MATIIKQLGELDQQYTKMGIAGLAKRHATQLVQADTYDLLAIYIELKRYETYLQSLIDSIKPPALGKAKQAGRPSFSYAGATVKVVRQRQLDYSSDEFWEQANATLEEVKRLKKERENFLKSIKGTHRDVVDSDTGEVHTVMAPTAVVEERLVICL